LNRRVVITGVGLVTPIGIGIEPTWQALCAGTSGIGPITRFDATGFDTRIAAEVKHFHAEEFMPRKEAQRTQLFIAYAIAGARMALADAALTINGTLAHRIGVITGCGLGGLAILEETARTVQEKGPKRVTPFFIPTMIGNMAAGMISIQVGAKGPNSSVATACAAGTHAVGDAFKLIQTGRADAMITGGVESVITPTCIAGFNAMKALSTRNNDPAGASRPFDRDRDGFVVGEGCGILVLEEYRQALDRGARIYAEVVGYGMSGDGHHMTAPAPEGEGAVRCMAAALADAGLGPEAIGYINAHGTSTQLNDLYETQAVKTVFGDHSRRLCISSTKSMTGHLLGGAGGIESVFTALAIQRGMLPPTINLDHPDEGFDLDFVPHTARPRQVDFAMSNSFGFGGTNASIILARLAD